ncbi:hypothetical protein CIB95_10485 [Lottiidibacillus patelloidae]|uniref:Carbohydrate diacid regulator n=1 Tax=Lottiidibacillus patelloidae TaxID=2670334 RepID=A0A263BSE8_9BACI|nr:sugar diacid recognition domain-containing protein [Lottiidibacillus patelloidae]OZM56643.1 hypothetical protein CIB95_10485 [Lottiidibacillus patelloidae]
MKITRQLAEPILKKLSGFLDYKINVMNEKGMIVASSDTERINQIHEGAVYVISNKKQLVISPEDQELYAGSKPGVNLPIEYFDEIVGVVGVTGDPKELYKFAKIIKITVEVMIQQVYVNNQMQYKNRLVEGWIHDLVSPTNFNKKVVEKNGENLLGIDFKIERTIILISLPDLTPNNWQSFETMVKLSEKKSDILRLITKEIAESSICSFINNDTCLVAIESKGKNITNERFIAKDIHKKLKLLNINSFVGIGNGYTGVEGYRNSYYQAKQCLEIIQLFKTEEPISHISDWKLERILVNIPEKTRNELIEEFLSNKKPLSAESLHTLEVFFKNQLRVNDTALALNIHRNTLQYRLDRVYKQVGLNPRNFNDASILMIVMFFYKMKR